MNDRSVPGRTAMSAGTGAGFLYEQVAHLIRERIDCGELLPGQRAPSLRTLKRELDVSLATAQQAYAHLEQQGYLQARPQSGFYVAHVCRGERAPRWSTEPAAPGPVRLGRGMNEILAAAEGLGVVPLGVAKPPAAWLPTKALNRSMRRLLAKADSSTVDYAPMQGDVGLRRAIAARASRTGQRVSAEHVLITSGATEALLLCLRQVARPGDLIAVESPTYSSLLQLIKSLGMLAVEIVTHPTRGLTIDALQATLDSQNVAAVISVGTFNNPTGSLIDAHTKRDIVALLSRRRIPLIEDDIYGELYFGEHRPPTFQSFDSDGTVLCCSAFSKTVAPGYRVGWIVAPPRHLPGLLDLKLITSSSTASLPQQVIADFLHHGLFERHANRLRRLAREQVRGNRQALLAHSPADTRISDPAGGLVLWVQLPGGIDAHTLYRHAIESGISITPGPLFTSTRRYRNFIRVCAGLPASNQVDTAIARLGELIVRLRG